MNAEASKAEVFDVFLCHNSADKPAVREIARKLVGEGIKPWLDEREIRPGTSWQTALEEQIGFIKSAAVFVGDSGTGPWQLPEIQAFLNQFVKRACPVIPVVLHTAKTTPKLPLLLENLHWVDFRDTHLDPVQQLIWGITGKKPRGLFNIPDSEKPATMQESDKVQLLPSGDERVATRRVCSGDRLYPPLASFPDPEQATQLEILRRRVQEYWVDGVLRHSLYNEVLISLGKLQIDKAVDAPWKYTVEVSDAVNSPSVENRDISAIYDATGLLLILGEPGSGKTTTLLDLARTLLDRAEKDMRERVPVVLNLSSWKRQPVVEWMSGELSEKYRVPRKTAQLWLQNQYLLPLLDGLDEVETTLQSDCVTAINTFIEESNPSGLVVCSRLNEYCWLPERLKLNGAISLESLTVEEIEKYLVVGGPKLATLREAIAIDPVFQELAQTPLMLSVMSLAFQGAGSDQLVTQKGDSVEERRKQIFRLYVEQMFLRKQSTAPVFPKERIIGWLSWLAKKMREHSQSVFLVEGLQPSWLSIGTQQITYGTVVSLSLGLIFALTGGLIGIVSRSIIRFVIGLIAGPIVLVAVGLVCRWESSLKKLVVSLSIDDYLSFGQCLLMYGLIPGLVFGLLSGLIFGLKVGLNVGLIVCLIGWLIVVLISRLIIRLFVGLIAAFGAVSVKKISLVKIISQWKRFWYSTIPNLFARVLRLIFELILRVIVGLNNGLIVGLILGLIVGLVVGLNRGPIVGLVVGLVTGLITGLMAGVGDGSLDEITLVETISWKWNQFWNRTIPGLIVGLIFGLILGLFVWLNSPSTLEMIELPQGVVQPHGTGLIAGLIGVLTGGLTLGLIFALVSGLVGGLTDAVKLGKASPNQGIKLSLKNSLAPFGVTWLTSALLSGLLLRLFSRPHHRLIDWLTSGLLFGLVFGLIVGLNRGGSAVIKHYALRLILWRKGYTPFNFIKFLDHCARLILLKKVGGGYIFIHRMLLDYFADMPQVHERKSKP